MNVAELAATLGWEIDFDTIAKYQSQLNKARENTERLDEETRKLAQATKLVTELRGDQGKALAMISPGVPGAGGGASGEVDKAAAGTSRWARALEVANDGLGVALKGYHILASGVSKLQGLFTATADAAAHANDTAERLGISVEAVQELGYAASQSGSDIDTLAGGMGKLADKVDAAKKGGKDAAKSLRAAGLDVNDIRSGYESLDGALDVVADKFAAMPDGAKKSALAVDLFGGAGVKLIPFLNKGSAGIKELREEAHRLGIVMSGDTTKAVAGLGDEQGKLKDQLAGIRNQAIAALVPMLSTMVKSLQEWVAANRELLIEALTGALKGLIYVLQAVGVVLTHVVDVVGWFSRHATAAKALLGALATAFIYFGVTAAAAWVAALWPVALVAAAVAGLILAWPYLVKAAEAAGQAIVGAFRSIGRALDGIWRGIKSVFGAIGGFFASIAHGIKSVFQGAVNLVIDGINFVTSKLDWVIRQANKIPGVNIGTIGAIDHVGGGGPRTASVAPGRGGTTVNNSIGAINVTSPAADPAQVAVHVRREVADAMNSMLLEADAGVA